MKLRPWNPAETFDDMLRRFEPMLHWPTAMVNGQRNWLPATDISENAESYQLKVEMPEISKDDIQLAVEDGYLVLSGERKYEHTDDKQHLNERFHGQFTRRFQLPDNVDDTAIDARFENGMLYLALPKTEVKKERCQRIDIH
ncbi:Hsp20/alpha crystallin family protein [Shewanella zhangzhouensis]|uniref:Hsp20/alpha crystallin family protein n=1 Tax=Shewanella zhangzhouensis TaxID=2864213 RepID=UPI001C66003A|nr:Hsp20/alpha crystallin family protein [Shewanella zhangzhouensis]QYK05207.1 Hsp20/alpha crystallin family protein [Shewanella zhangzhouensis]